MRLALWARAALAAGVLLAWPAVAAAQTTWTPTATVGAPQARTGHTAVWTGSRMIVWGGRSGPTDLDSGGIYDPGSDTWSAPISTTGAPSARSGHVALWTGSRMIVWGGLNGFDDLGTGGVYDPSTDAWMPTSTIGAPLPRESFTAVWTGSKMIVWGGFSEVGPLQVFGDGGVYDPATNTWTSLSTAGAPDPRWGHTAVWTGSRMIVWGGSGGASVGLGFGLNTGGIYDPEANTWIPTSMTGAPSARNGQAAVSVGSTMVVWGGVDTVGAYLTSGGIYDTVRNSWTATSNEGVPINGYTYPDYSAVTTGAQMIIWGGFPPQGGRTSAGRIFDLASNTWTPTAVAGAPPGQYQPSAVWTGSTMIVWGGTALAGDTNAGGIYNPQVVSAHHTDYYTVTPCRAVDTREPSRGGPDPLPAGLNRAFTILGVCDIPATARAVSLNITVTQPTQAGDLRLYPLGTMLPVASAINYGPGQTRASNVVAAVGDGGTVGVHVDQASGTVHLVIDVNGYFQ